MFDIHDTPNNQLWLWLRGAQSGQTIKRWTSSLSAKVIKELQIIMNKNRGAKVPISLDES